MKPSNSSQVLRYAIVAEWLLIAAGVAMAFVSIESLPEPLAAYAAQEVEWRPLVDSLALLLLFGSLASSIGLWHLRKWARLVYMLCTVALSAMVVLDAPLVQSSLVSAIEELSLLVSGFIIGLAYFGVPAIDAQQAVQGPTSPPSAGPRP